MDNTIIIKIESGVVADVYATDPAQVIIVDYDMIEGDETFERRVQKAVFSTTTDHCVNPDEIDTVVTSLIGDCIRPVRRRAG
jgi:hypothetical protein